MKHYMIYELYDGDTLIDSGNIHELSKRWAVTEETLHKDAYKGCHMLWKYTVRKAGIQTFIDDLDEKIKAEYAQGYSRKQIAARLDVSYAAVVKRIERMAKRGEMVL